MNSSISIKQAANKWGISERRVQKLCQDGRIEGAFRFGRSWAIPSDTKKPDDARAHPQGEVQHIYTDIRTVNHIYGSQIRVLTKSKVCTVYFVENNTGSGVVTHYRVFPGVAVFYNDFHMMEGFVHENAVHDQIMEINHCREGRFECEFYSGEFAYFGEGDLGINTLANQPAHSCFPLSHYHGITIAVDIIVARNTIEKAATVLGNVQIDLEEIRGKMSSDYVILRADERIQHIFSELYNVPDNMKESYLPLKIIELFLFLGSTELNHISVERMYIKRAQVDIIKQIRKYLTEHLDEKVTLAVLSQRFNISLTAMKTCFKSIYGVPISSYMREYRMQVAAKYLRESNDSIADIALQVGYENAAKFSAAFQKSIGQSPSDYRKTSV